MFSFFLSLNETKEKLDAEKAHLDSVEQARHDDINHLKSKFISI